MWCFGGTVDSNQKNNTQCIHTLNIFTIVFIYIRSNFHRFDTYIKDKLLLEWKTRYMPNDLLHTLWSTTSVLNPCILVGGIRSVFSPRIIWWWYTYSLGPCLLCWYTQLYYVTVGRWHVFITWPPAINTLTA